MFIFTACLLSLVCFIFYNGDVEEAVLEGEDNCIAYFGLVVESRTIEASNPDVFILKIEFYIVTDAYT